MAAEDNDFLIDFLDKQFDGELTEEVEVGAVERVIRDMPEGVFSDLALPLRIGADANALLEHVEGGVELAGDERLVGGEVHRLTFMFRARRSARLICRW